MVVCLFSVSLFPSVDVVAGPADPAPDPNGVVVPLPEQIHLHAGHIEQAGSKVLITGGFSGKSNHYSLVSDWVTATLIPGARSIDEVSDAIFHGNPESGKQVDATMVSAETGQSTEILSDTLTYKATPGLTSYGYFTFSGHVHMKSYDESILAKPGDTSFEQLRVTIGPGPKYPSIDGDNVDATFVPARKPGREEK